jgi:limonene-1,2-epoxide hydrolase
MADNAAIVRDFIRAWSRLDPDEIAAYFTEDGVYHNIPTEPVAGRDNVRQFIAGFSASWTATDWEIVTLVADGDTVVCERVDRIRTEQGGAELPCCGVFEMQDGKIRVWRDYFDLGTFTQAMDG